MPDELSAMMQVVRNGVPRIVIAVAARKYDDADFHLWEGLGSSASGRRGLFAGNAALFDRRLAITLFQRGQNDGSDKFLLALFIEFNYDVIIVTGKHRAETKLSMLDLGALGECRFTGHGFSKGPYISDCNSPEHTRASGGSDRQESASTSHGVRETSRFL